MKILQHKFVDFIPNNLEDDMLYISIEYCTAIHKCICGCGNEVVTPISPTDWQLTFNGKTVSLHPSIGNWNFECRSHYWINNNKIKHASSLMQKENSQNREKDKRSKEKHVFQSENKQKKIRDWKKYFKRINKSNG